MEEKCTNQKQKMKKEDFIRNQEDGELILKKLYDNLLASIVNKCLEQ